MAPEKGGVESFEEPVPFEDALKVAGFGKYQYLVTCAGGLSLFSYIIGVNDVSYILPAAECDFNLTAHDKGSIQSLCFIGILCSSHLFGVISDTLGRRYLLYKCMLAHSVVAFVSSLAPNFTTFIILRFVTGFLVCSASIASYTYVGEFHTSKERAVALVAVAAIGATSLIYLPITAWLILPIKCNVPVAPGLMYTSWRLYIAVGGIPSVISGILLFILPESPKFLLSRGYSEKALQVLQTIYSWNGKGDSEDFPIKHVVIDSNDNTEELDVNMKNISEIVKLLWNQTMPLFKAPFISNTVSACIIQFGTFMCVNSILLWMPELFTKLGRLEELNPNYKPTLCEVLSRKGTEMLLHPHHNFTSQFHEQILQNINNPNKNITTQNTRPDVKNTTKNENKLRYSNSSNSVLSNTKKKSWKSFSVFHMQHKRQCSLSRDSIIPNILIGGIQVLTFCLTFLLFFLDRRFVLKLFLFIAIISGVCILMVRYKYLVLILTGAIPIFACMACSILTTMVVDFFPTNLRAMGMCIAMMSGKLGAVVGSELAGFLLDNHCPVFFLLVIIALSGNEQGTYYAVALPVHSSSNACETLKPGIFHMPIIRNVIRRH
ncbi:synaptic vesicle glycoprotein 2B-like [Lycorma delicatula]|uniref:synaptic vesicle glycoprotein 2B-like n=1 Tax=Lycorma delicatula TaxID=130591 RepID=UPI003F51A363